MNVMFVDLGFFAFGGLEGSHEEFFWFVKSDGGFLCDISLDFNEDLWLEP